VVGGEQNVTSQISRMEEWAAIQFVMSMWLRQGHDHMVGKRGEDEWSLPGSGAKRRDLKRNFWGPCIMENVRKIS
jgi:hypothetical protein